MITAFFALVDAGAIAGLFGWAIGGTSDKGIVVFMFYYPLLIAMNTFVWFILKVLDHPARKPMGRLTLILLGLFIPLAVVASYL